MGHGGDGLLLAGQELAGAPGGYEIGHRVLLRMVLRDRGAGGDAGGRSAVEIERLS